MTATPISNVARRVQFTGNTTTGPFAFTFNILADSDLVVIKNTTTLTITTHYTVSTNANGTGSVTLGSALVASDILTIIGGRDLERTTDFVTAGDLLASSLNEQLDSLVIMAQQLDEKVGRAIIVNAGDESVSLEMPTKDNRKGTVLAFNATSGAPEAGPTIADVSTVAAITADITALADIEDGTTATDAISGLAAIKANVTTVAGVASNVTTVAGIASNVTAVAADATDIGAVAAKATEIGLLGTSDAVADMALLGTSDAVSDMNALAAITSDISAVGAKASIITATLASDLTTVSPQVATLQSLAGIFSGTQTIAVTVVSSGGSNYFAINGITAAALTLVKGITYTFDVSDSSVSGHPLAFKDSGGSAFTTGVTTNGTAGSAGANVVIVVPTTGTMPARYYCTSHGNGMGNTIATQANEIAQVAADIPDINIVANNLSTIGAKATIDEATALAIAL